MFKYARLSGLRIMLGNLVVGGLGARKNRAVTIKLNTTTRPEFLEAGLEAGV